MRPTRWGGLAGALAMAAVVGACERPTQVGEPHARHAEHGRDAGHGGDGDHADRAEAEAGHGPHGGRLLEQGDFAVELVLVERGVPPELRAYPYRDGAPLSPADVRVAVELRRFGGRVDRVAFSPRGDHLVGDRRIEEPHSFDVAVDAGHADIAAHWEYASYEGRTEMAAGAIEASGIEIATAGPARIRTTVKASGRLAPNADRLVHAVPRYPGIVKEARKRLGDQVQAGEVLAVVESNQSLQSYEVRAPLAGTVIAKHAAPGELAGDSEPVYVVADLSTIWVDVQALPADFRKLRLGQRAVVQGGGPLVGEGRVVHLSPFGSEVTQTVLARIEIDNAAGEWHPGLFAQVEVVIEEADVPVTVRPSALQTFRDSPVVFVNEGSTFQAMPVELGRRDRDAVEIVAGLVGGERYAAANSFIVKADVGKSGASHDH